jgi:hypothetical protein
MDGIAKEALRKNDMFVARERGLSSLPGTVAHAAAAATAGVAVAVSVAAPASNAGNNANAGNNNSNHSSNNNGGSDASVAAGSLAEASSGAARWHVDHEAASDHVVTRLALPPVADGNSGRVERQGAVESEHGRWTVRFDGGLGASPAVGGVAPPRRHDALSSHPQHNRRREQRVGDADVQRRPHRPVEVSEPTLASMTAMHGAAAARDDRDVAGVHPVTFKFNDSHVDLVLEDPSRRFHRSSDGGDGGGPVAIGTTASPGAPARMDGGRVEQQASLLQCESVMEDLMYDLGVRHRVRCDDVVGDTCARRATTVTARSRGLCCRCCVIVDTCCAVLCCAVLCCAVLCCAVLCCAVLCCAVLCCAVLCCAVM